MKNGGTKVILKDPALGNQRIKEFVYSKKIINAKRVNVTETKRTGRG